MRSKINGEKKASSLVLNSMTGFAAASGVSDLGKWDWEIRSVNGKGLDLRLRLPDGFEALEPAVRAAAKDAVTRGNITVTLRYVRAASEGQFRIDPNGLSAALKALAEIDDASQSSGLSLAPMNAADVAALPGVLAAQSDGTTDIPDALKNQISEVFQGLVAMRVQEGTAIGTILEAQLDQIAAVIDASEKSAEARAARRGDILREKVTSLLETGTELDPQRLHQELAILAVKADVTEEIDRLRAHVGAARGLISTGGPVGRKLDFLMQEFNREANTLCSKSGSTDLTALGMELKVLIDQMREQVQNLE